MVSATELTRLYREQNEDEDERLFEENFLSALSEQLEPDEEVALLLEFNADLERNPFHGGARNVREALLVVTAQRVFLISRKGVTGQLLGMVQGYSESGDVSWTDLVDVAGVSGRRTGMSLGLDRALHLHLKEGSFVKILGLASSTASTLRR